MFASIVRLDLETGEVRTTDGHRCNIFKDTQRTIVKVIEPMFEKYEVVYVHERQTFPSWTAFMQFIGIM